MVHSAKIRGIVIAAFICLQCANAQIKKDEQGKDVTHSPYFEIPGKRGEKETLPLLSTNALANIAGVIANVKVTQVYVNRGKTSIEASYVFPLSTRAAVYAMHFKLGKRIIRAQIQGKRKAFDMYTKAKNEGKTASLLQEDRPNVFQMNVANIMPGDTIKVELNYTELLLNTEGVYEFVYPTVAGPRYTNDVTTDGMPKEDWIGTPYTKEQQRPSYKFDIKTRINAGMPIQEINCSSHQTSTVYEGKNTAQINLMASDTCRGNKDFILRYRLAGNKVEEGVLLYESGKENFFLMMMQPPKVVTAKELPGREYIFIIDVSGSQSGFPLEISQELMQKMLAQLKPSDKFNVMIFEGDAGFISDSSLVASAANIQLATNFVMKQRGGGGTELMIALKKALSFPKTKNYARTFVIATDGYVSVEAEAFDYIRNNLGQANFFTFGIGTSVNRFLIEGMAHAGMAEPFFVTSEKEAPAAAEKFKEYISNPVLTHIQVQYEGLQVYDVVPLNIPDVFAQRPIIVFGKYKGPAAGKISVSGINASGNYFRQLNLAEYKPEKANAALKYLWAREKIRGYELKGKLERNVEREITALGLKYNLLTEFTSFVAVDNAVRNKGGKQDSVVQALPLPEGVSENALGMHAYTKKSSGKYAIQHAVTANYAHGDMNVSPPVMADVALDAVEVEPVLLYAAEMPAFPGGQKALQQFILNNLKYPDEAKEIAIEGAVYIQFTVAADGSIKDIKVLKSPHPLLSDEAIRILKLMPNWSPGRNAGRTVAVQYCLPVRFTLKE